MRGRVNMHRKNRIYRCFCCFHVKSGALALGTWHLLVHLFAISLLAYMSANLDDINSSVQSLTIYIRRAKTETLSMPSSNDDLSDATATLTNSSSNAFMDKPIALPVSLQNPVQETAVKMSSDKDVSDNEEKKLVWHWTSYVYTYAGVYQPQLSQHDLNAAFVIGCIIVAISLMLIMGIVKGKPAYMFPFLGYQLGDLFVSSLTVAGVVCLGPNIKQFLLTDEDFPYREEIEQLDNQWIVLSIALAVLIVVFVKAYLVQIVWLTIRFLREEMIRKSREECQPKVIFMDASSPVGEIESTLFMFDGDGGVIKKSPPPSYEQFGEEEKVAPPAYTA